MRRRSRILAISAATIAVTAVTAAVFHVTAPFSSAVPAVKPTNADQRAVVATVEAFAEAWQEGDCATYLKLTTQREQDDAGITQCAAFERRADAFGEVVTHSDLTIVDIRGSENW